MTQNQNHEMKSLPIIDETVWAALLKRMLSVAIRAQINKSNQTRLWTIELVFYGTPLQSGHHKEQGLRRAVYLQYDMISADLVHNTVDDLLNDWSKIVYLYYLIHNFADLYTNGEFLLVVWSLVDIYLIIF